MLISARAFPLPLAHSIYATGSDVLIVNTDIAGAANPTPLIARIALKSIFFIFLHSSLVTEKWDSIKKLKTARIESFISIFLGGIVSLSIIVTAASVNTQDVRSVIDLARGLEPLYGKFAIYFLGIGLFASGITSSITAPLAAAYVAKSCFGWKDSMKSLKFRLVWMIVLIFGVVISLIELNPIEIIKFAQFSNSLLLPIIAIILLWLVNNNSIIGKEYGYRYQNIFGIIIIMITIILGIRGLILIF